MTAATVFVLSSFDTGNDIRHHSGEVANGGFIVESLAEEWQLAESPPTLDLAEFIAGMSKGNERALELLYDATVSKLYALARAILRNVEDAEEVVCATYAYAWANAAEYDDHRGNALGWLLMLCRSRSLDVLRQRRANVISSELAPIEGVAAEDQQPDDLFASLQQCSRVRAALAELTPERRRLISLAYLQDLSHQQIAAATGLALGTVKSHLRRALAQLRDHLETT
jgi:RNA polymerase sigma-70 factor (ECF subfamily)